LRVFKILLAALGGLVIGGCSLISKPSPRLLLIGIDGADWDLINQLRGRGELPNLDRLVREGTSAHLHSPEPLLSPLLWTSIATGRAPLEHGITWFFSQDDNGQLIPVSGARRQVPALWEVAAQGGLKVAVVGWWATWPAERVPGVLVSDRVASHGFGVGGKRPAAALIYPPDRAAELLRLIPKPDSFVPPELKDIVPKAGWRALPGVNDGDDSLTAPELLRGASAEVEGYFRIAQKLLKERAYDLFCVYFEGVDTSSHVFMAADPPALPSVDPSFAATYGQVVRRFYRYQDRILGQLLAAVDQDTAVIVVSDHGFRTGSKRLPLPEAGWKLETAHRDHLPYGILILQGPMFRRDFELRSPELLQVAPTALYALGLPLERDLASRVLQQAFTADFAADHPVQIVERYPKREPPRIPGGSEGSEEAFKRLQALGYVGGSQNDLLLQEINNRVSMLGEAGRFDEAAGLLEKYLQREPQDVKMIYNLGSLRLSQERLDLAREVLRRAKQLASDSAEVAMLEGRILFAERRLPESEKFFLLAIQRDPKHSAAMVSLGDLLHRTGRDQEAVGQLEAALDIDPYSVDGWYNLGVAQESLGRPEQALGSYRHAVDLEPSHAFALGNLGILAEKAGDRAGAERYFRQAITASPKDRVANIHLGILLLKEGRAREAVEPLRMGVELQPDSVALRKALERAEAMAGVAQDPSASTH
jgi:predicted AlkP superfamily phosphohydrolase/phosphomutase/tetratricopeptide (TPR) repeat protein